MSGPYSSNKVIAAGVSSPGFVKLEGFERPKGWDVKDASGQDGGTTTRKGQPVGKGSFVHQLSDWPDESGKTDYDEWPAWQALWESTTDGKTPVAIEVVHPELQRLHYTALVLDKIGPHAEDGKGGGSIKIDVLEYAPPKPKPAGSPGKAKAAAQAVKDLADNTPLIPYDPSAADDADMKKQSAEDPNNQPQPAAPNAQPTRPSEQYPPLAPPAQPTPSANQPGQEYGQD